MAERRMSEEIQMSAATTSTSVPRPSGRWSVLAAGLAFALIWAVGAVHAAPAAADVPIASFESYPSSTQAGSHPDLFLNFKIGNRNFPQLKDPDNPGKFLPCACNEAKDIVINMPAGVIGNPHATPQCNASDFVFFECPIDSQVGFTNPTGCLAPSLCGEQPEPIYNLIPPPGAAGLIGFNAPLFSNPIYTYLTARTGGDYGLRATVSGAQRTIPLLEYSQVLWGTPADPKNDAYRFDEPCTELCDLVPPKTGWPSNSPQVPFVSNPTTCGEALSSTLTIVGYDHEVTRAETPWPATTGCSKLGFNPSLAANPTTTRTDTPSGIDINLSVPQTLDPSTPSPSSIKAATVELPPGFTINPNAADGKTSCSDAAAKFGTEDQAQCPEFSKVGTLEVHSTVLPGVLPGGVYLGDPQPGNRYRLFLVADGFGLHVKLPGSVLADPQSGRLTISFQNLPQTPFENFNMHIFGSERGILGTPTQCGTYPVRSTFAPWNSVLPEQTSVQFFTLDSGPNGTPCPGTPRPFAPRFTASSLSTVGGAHSPFTVELRRDDGDQNLTGLSVTTPLGFSGTLKGIPYCPESALAQLSSALYTGLAEMAATACPAASQLGVVTAGAGAGSKPLFTAGKVFLAGPYKGAPLSLQIVIPAVSGPYDLGNVAVRTAITVDPVSAQVTAASDPLPQIIEGIPLRTRFIRVDLDRPDFALNPTNCEPRSVRATVTGDEGATSITSTHYQVGNCAILPFKPKLKLKLTGSTKQAGNPALTATLTAKPGEANISRAQVTLPPTELVDNAHIRTICTRVQFNAGNTPGEKCPAGSVIGFGRAETPLLDNLLEGPIYLRSTGRAGLPDLVVALNGQIDIVLDARIDSVNGRLRTTFETVPDAPVTKVVLSFYGGHRGIIENSPRLCAHAQHFTAAITGQNGKTFNRRPVLSTPCGKKHKRKARGSKARHKKGRR